MTKRADFYDAPAHDYLRYWDGRDYENAAEQAAIRRLLHGRHFTSAADVGGGYGRLCLLLQEFADRVTLAEPSSRQLEIAATFLADHPRIEHRQMQADALSFADSSLDLLTMIRVMHHIPEPSTEFSEIARVLRPGGTAVIEVANLAHARNRVRYLLRGQRIPHLPVDIRSEANRHDDEIAFVNHNPHTVIEQLARAGLRTERLLSVSNLRSTTLKKVLSHRVHVAAEVACQRVLAHTFFGPSVFLLLRKA
ncbi:class I SAM-dependent methyltransferase [Kutzneria sp. NPDC051319]|uniref:class I SAM-dependent methyltransferase n=1 Tax=Kutzneria sp. NPDC051319 TaxID=3155047 RepID=UPI003427F528